MRLDRGWGGGAGGVVTKMFPDVQKIFNFSENTVFQIHFLMS